MSITHYATKPKQKEAPKKKADPPKKADPDKVKRDLFKRAGKLRDELEEFVNDARHSNEPDVADVAKRAWREFNHPSFVEAEAELR